MASLQIFSDAALRRVAVATLVIAVSPSVALASAQLEMFGSITTTDPINVDFNLAGGPNQALFATYSHSGGISESSGRTYGEGGIDSVIELRNGVGTLIAANDDLTSPPGTRDSEIATPFGTAAPRPGYTPIAALSPGNYQIRLRPFSFGTLGDTSWSMESRLFAGRVTIEAPQVPIGADINVMRFDGFGDGPHTMNIGPGDNLLIFDDMFMSREVEIAMTGGSFTAGGRLQLSDVSGSSNIRQTGGTSSFGQLTLGSNSFAGGAAEYNFYGGVLVLTNNLTVGAGDVFDLAGGELRVNSLSNVTVTNAADFRWSHGTILLQNDAPTENTFQVFGPTLTLTPGRVLRTTFAQSFDSAIVLEGGKLSVPNLASGHPVQLKSGELSLTGAGGLTIGLGGPLGSNVTLPTGLTVSVTNATTVGSTAALALDGGTLSSGTLANNGLIRGEGVVSAATTNAVSGEIRAQAGKTLTFAGTNGANAGTINLQGGTVQFSQAMTNGTNGQILGRGVLSAGGAGLTNNGHIALSSGITDVFGDVSNNTASASKGISISGNADVTFWDDVSNVGISLFKVSAGSSATFFGTYSGAGVSGLGNKFMEADVSPGASPGIANFGGNVTLSSNAKLFIELGGTISGTQHDQLDIDGLLALDGTLDVSLINGFSLVAGQSFNILDWGSLAGTFSSLTLPTLTGLAWDTSQLYINGVLAVAPGLPGDFNHDGTVDAADYVVWRKGVGVAPTPANYNLWRAHFGETLSGGGSSQTNGTVPEPATLVMVLMGVLAMFSHRRANVS